jgi:acyl dehydratase
MTITSVDLGDLSSGDHEWIHVDEQGAAAGRFGAAIAHGYLTVSLVPYLLPTFFQGTGTSMGPNFGCGKAGLPAPLRAGTRVRCEADPLSVDALYPAGWVSDRGETT